MQDAADDLSGHCRLNASINIHLRVDIEAGTKCICRRHPEMYFPYRKYVYFEHTFTYVCSWNFDKQVSISSSNGIAPNVLH